MALTMVFLQERRARDVLDGIDESRRLGVKESLTELSRSELRQVATTRRRPPTNIELLQIVIELLYQRLVIIPKIGAAINERLAADNIVWRVDTEFVSVGRVPEVQLSDLLPTGVEDVMTAMARIIQLTQISALKHRM